MGFEIAHLNEVAVVRHAHFVAGPPDKLSPDGMIQASNLGKKLRENGFIRSTGIITSTALRAIETGEIVCAELGGYPREMFQSELLGDRLGLPPSSEVKILQGLLPLLHGFLQAVIVGHSGTVFNITYALDFRRSMQLGMNECEYARGVLITKSDMVAL